MNSEEKYIAVYGRDGTHISNIQLSKWNITRKVFDLDVSNFEGSCDEDITSGLIFVMNDKYGNKEYSGFMKSIIQDKKTGHVTFKGEDLRSIWDTEVLLDFTPFDDRFDYKLDDMFNFVKNAVLAQASSLYTINVIIPTNSTTTEAVGRFDGTYSYTNASEFLKVYLAYYNYYLSANYDIANKEIDFEFIAANVTRSIRLDDFIFTQTLSEVKTNHTVARVKDENNLQKTKRWVWCSEDDFNAAYAAGNASIELEVESWQGIPMNAEDLPIGYAFKGSNQVPENIHYYWKVERTEHVWQRFSSFSSPTGAQYYAEQDPSQRVTITLPFPTTQDPQVGNPEIDPNNYELGTALKITWTSWDVVYYKAVLNTSELSDDIPQAEYYLGLDNEVHEDTILLSNQIYPVKTKYFEDEYLAKAQFNAIWELVNSRYNENIILDKISSPVDITNYNLYDMITVYDANGDSKELPVSEIRWTQNSYRVKLGFKKERFTDIFKEATGSKSTGAISIKHSNKILQDLGRLGNLSDIK